MKALLDFFCILPVLVLLALSVRLILPKGAFAYCRRQSIFLLLAIMTRRIQAHSTHHKMSPSASQDSSLDNADSITV
jgi:hypothetical protein